MNISRSLRSRTAAAVLVCTIGLLAACGGGELSGTVGQPRALAEAPGHRSAAAVAPVQADPGRAFDASDPAAPADPGARTRSARYLSPAQAEQLERTWGEAVLNVDIDCCGHDAYETAIGLAYAHEAAHDLPRDAPVLVRAQDLRQGAATVERLAFEGYGSTWLVVPLASARGRGRP